MNFAVIIVALALLQWRGTLAGLQRDDWFLATLRILQPRLSPPLTLVLSIGVPALLVGALCLAFATAWWGIPLFLVELLVLLYSLGRGDLRVELNGYLERWRRGDIEAAYRYACEHACGLVPASGREPVDSAEDLHERMRSGLLYRGLERWFAVVFWFALGGPAAGLAYRLLQLAASTAVAGDRLHSVTRAVLIMADWIPARLLGLSFALMGHFGDTMAVWRRTLLQAVPVDRLLVEYQQAALQVAHYHNDDTAAVLAGADRELNGTMALLTRSVVLWILVLALAQLW